MQVFEVFEDGDERFLGHVLTQSELNEILDWWRYTKPFGPNVRIVVRDRARNALTVTSAGTDVSSVCDIPERLASEIFVG